MGIEILDFYADWCGPCKMFAPTMDEFRAAHPEIKVTAV
ncbi:thioredoxin family protein, partial [Candidatus Saccharibacteria bacterium]|nr:thioredoxin family protein [Candidatus Saccharibacteria bacterium]